MMFVMIRSGAESFSLRSVCYSVSSPQLQILGFMNRTVGKMLSQNHPNAMGKKKLFFSQLLLAEPGRFPWKLASLTPFPCVKPEFQPWDEHKLVGSCGCQGSGAAGTASRGYFEKLSKNIASLAVNNFWGFLSSEMLESFPSRQQVFTQKRKGFFALTS